MSILIMGHKSRELGHVFKVGIVDRQNRECNTHAIPGYSPLVNNKIDPSFHVLSIQGCFVVCGYMF